MTFCSFISYSAFHNLCIIVCSFHILFQTQITNSTLCMRTERDRPMCREGRHLYPCSLFLTFSKHSQLQRDTIQHLVYARSAYIFAGSLAVTNAPHISHFNIPENYIFQKENYSQSISLPF